MKLTSEYNEKKLCCVTLCYK